MESEYLWILYGFFMRSSRPRFSNHCMAKMKFGSATVANIPSSILLGIFVTSLLLSAASAQNSSTSNQYVPSAKEVPAMAIQLEHRKMIVFWAVEDFEKSLYTSNVSDCERRRDRPSELLSNGVKVQTCKDLIEQRRNAGHDGRQKLKLRNQIIEFTETGARVNVDVQPAAEHHVVVLRDINEHWLVANFASAPKE